MALHAPCTAAREFAGVPVRSVHLKCSPRLVASRGHGAVESVRRCSAVSVRSQGEASAKQMGVGGRAGSRVRDVRCLAKPPPMRDAAGQPNTSQMLVFVPPHPLLKHWLAVARSSATPPQTFRSALAELGRLLIYEARPRTTRTNSRHLTRAARRLAVTGCLRCQARWTRRLARPRWSLWTRPSRWCACPSSVPASSC